MKKRLDEEAKLLDRISSQQAEILALKMEVEKYKKHYEPLIADFNDFLPLREILALMPGNIFWKDNNGKLLGCNHNNAQIFGFSSSEGLLEKYSKDFLPEILAEQIDKNDQEIMESGQGKFFEEMGVDANNKTRVYFCQKIPLHDDSGKVRGLLGMSIDITERKKIENELNLAKEKAEALSRAKSEFLALINHELRSPLTGIIGLVNCLRQGNLTKDNEKNTIEDLENCSNYLLSLVNDILDFSKLEADKMNVDLCPVDIKNLINEVSRFLTTLAKNKGLHLQTHIDKNTPKFILSDAKILRQILVNIIGNAIKFTENGNIDVTINLIGENQAKSILEIVIKDTGIGMPKDKMESIFEPFRQLENIYTRQSSRNGTGLGLSIVKKLADLLKLKIQVMSEEAMGTTFSLRGEFDIVNNEKMDKLINQKNSKKDAVLRMMGKKIKVLLVEDDAIVQRIHKMMLTELGCEVEIAACGKEALRLVNDHDILFVDIGLSDITGFEVISAIRKHGTMPIIVLTGYTGDDEREKCLKVGANKVVDKPVSPDGLQAILLDFFF